MTKEQKLLEWLNRSGVLLESQIVGSGMSRALNALLIDGKATMGAHPTVRERSGIAAAAVFSTKAPE